MADHTGTNEPAPTLPNDERVPPSSDAASAPARSGFTLRGRKWVYGATLAAAGVLAGSGVTYAVVSATPAAQSQAFQTDGSAPRGGGPMGGAPGGQQGTAPDGQAPDGQPSGGASSAAGETT